MGAQPIMEVMGVAVVCGVDGARVAAGGTLRQEVDGDVEEDASAEAKQEAT